MAKDSDVKVLKGQEAEDKILEYLRRMNRPFGAVDVAANLKGQVPKTAAQKILVALAEKGHLVQKTYGKTNFFVINQDQVQCLSAEELTELEEKCKVLEETNKTRGAELKALSQDLAKLKAAPDQDQLSTQLAETEAAIAKTTARLEPLRQGAPLLSESELAAIQSDWVKWRTEWVRRRKVFQNLWAEATDALPPQEAESLAEGLGVEYDTTEHVALEKGWLCTPVDKKRKRP